MKIAMAPNPTAMIGPAELTKNIENIRNGNLCIYVLPYISFSSVSNNILIECTINSHCPNNKTHCDNWTCKGNKNIEILSEKSVFRILSSGSAKILIPKFLSCRMSYKYRLPR